MDPLIILIALLAAPLVLILWLRVNAALVFLSLCLGNILVEFLGPDAAKIFLSLSANTHGREPDLPYVNLFLLLLPVVLTVLIMMHSVKGKAKQFFNFFPAIGVSLLTTLLAVPLLSASLTGALTAQPLWRLLENLQTLILGVSALLALLFLWMQRPKSHGDEKHGKHH